jgi:hypothetical protein
MVNAFDQNFPFYPAPNHAKLNRNVVFFDRLPKTFYARMINRDFCKTVFWNMRRLAAGNSGLGVNRSSYSLGVIRFAEDSNHIIPKDLDAGAFDFPAPNDSPFSEHDETKIQGQFSRCFSFLPPHP